MTSGRQLASNWRNADSIEGMKNSHEHVLSGTGFNPCCCCFCNGRCPLSNWSLILGVVGTLMYLPIICIVLTYRHDILILNFEELFENLILRGWNLKLFNIHASLGLARTVQVYASLSCIMLIGHFLLIFSSVKISKLGTLVHPVTLSVAFVVQLVCCLVFQIRNEGISPIWLFLNFPLEVFVAICSLGLFSQIRTFVIEKTRSYYSSECDRPSDSRLRDIDTKVSLESNDYLLQQRGGFQTQKQSRNFSKTKEFSSRATVVNEKSQAPLNHFSLTSMDNNNNNHNQSTDNNNNNSDNNNNNNERNQNAVLASSAQRYIASPKAYIARLQPTVDVDVLNTSKSQIKLKASGKISQWPANADKNISRNNNEISRDFLRDLEEDKLYRDLEITRKRRTEVPKRRASRRKSRHRHRKHKSKSRRRR